MRDNLKKLRLSRKVTHGKFADRVKVTERRIIWKRPRFSPPCSLSNSN